MAPKKDIEDLFNRVSSTYDTVGPRFFTYFGRKLVAFAGVRPGSDVLDIATGRGAIVFAAAQAAPLKRIVGIDISEAMAVKTKKDATDNALNNVEILCMDAETLDFPDASFDFVFCGFALFFFTDTKAALREIHRVLKPDGALCVSCWTKADERRRWLIDMVKECLPGEVDFNEALRLLPKGFDTEEQITKAMLETGFSPNKSCIETMEICYKSAQEWWDAQYSHGIRSIFETVEKKIGADGLLRFKEDVFNKLNSMMENGVFIQTTKAIFVRAGKL